MTSLPEQASMLSEVITFDLRKTTHGCLGLS